MLIVSYRNRVFNNQGYVFACFAACNIDYFGIGVLPLIDCIFAYQTGQYFRYDHDDLHDALIIKNETTKTVDAPLMLIFRM